MALIEERKLFPSAVPRAIEGRAGEAVQLAADQMPQGVAGERIAGEEHDVQQQYQRPYADAEVQPAIGTGEHEGANDVIPKESQKNDRTVKKVTMNILQDEREAGFAAIVAVRALTHGAGRRIEEESAIVSFAIVVAGHAEAKRENQNQQRRRPVPPAKVEQRRVKRREVRIGPEKFSFEGAERGVDAKAAEQDDDGNCLGPPSVAAQRAS